MDRIIIFCRIYQTKQYQILRLYILVQQLKKNVSERVAVIGFHFKDAHTTEITRQTQ